MKTTYNYPANENPTETVATINGQSYTICKRYKTIDTVHTADCQTRKGLRYECTCGAFDSIDKELVIKNAIKNGKFGTSPEPIVSSPTKQTKTKQTQNREHGKNGWCEYCQDWCWGDCQS